MNEMMYLCGVGVAQHAQGDLEASVQAFRKASQDALRTADVAVMAGSQAAEPDTSHVHRQAATKVALQEAKPKRAVSPDQQRQAPSSLHAAGDSGNESFTASTSDQHSSSTADTHDELRVIRARRTAVRALLSEAGTLKQLGRPKEALAAAKKAAKLEHSVHSMHVAPLENEIAGMPEEAQL